MILFFDTETTGLPENYNAPVTDLDNWPRMIQLAYVFQNKDGKTISKSDKMVKPEGFEIHPEVTAVNGISNEIAKKEGEELKIVLEKFNSLIRKADFLVGHNIDFDIKIVEAEFLRTNLINEISSKKKICTMKLSTDFCAIKNPYGFKWPNLSELHQKLFNVDFEDAHNAASDVDATMKCFWELSKNGIIDVKKINQEYLKENFFKKSSKNSNSEVSLALAEKIIDFCIKNDLDEIPLSNKAYSILQFEEKCKQLGPNCNIDDELNFLKSFWNKTEANYSNGELNKYQQDFIQTIKIEIVEEHKNDSLFNGEKVKSFNDKVRKLEVIPLFLNLENDKTKELVISIYHYYLERYKEFLPSERKSSKFINMQKNIYQKYPAHIEKHHQNLERLLEEFSSTMDDKKPAMFPDDMYDFVQSCKIDLEKIKFEVGPVDNYYNNIASKIVVFSTDLLYKFIKGMPENTIHIKIDGMNHGGTLFEICLSAINEIEKIEVDDKTKNWFLEKKETFIAHKHFSQPKSGCYIATMAYGDYNHSQVKILRNFRDERLLPNLVGKSLVKFYYWTSPKLVALTKENDLIKNISKKTLDFFIKYFIPR